MWTISESKQYKSGFEIIRGLAPLSGSQRDVVKTMIDNDIPRTTLASIVVGFVGNQLCFPETNSSNLLYLLRIVLQNLLIAEVTCEVLELALEEGIQPNGRQPLVSSEKEDESHLHSQILPYDLCSVVLKRLVDVHHSF